MKHTVWVLLTLTIMLGLTSPGVTQAQTPDTPGDVQAAFAAADTARVIVALREPTGNIAAADINVDGITDILDQVIATGNYNRAGPLAKWE